MAGALLLIFARPLGRIAVRDQSRFWHIAYRKRAVDAGILTIRGIGLIAIGFWRLHVGEADMRSALSPVLGTCDLG